MSMIVLAIVMAVTVEGLVELGKSIGRAALQGDVKTAVTQICAAVISCILCTAVGADVYAALGVAFGIPWLGCILTGLFASRGSNYISDLIKKLQGLTS